MVDLTEDARHQLDRYLRRLRGALRGSSVDVADVQRDVMFHIDAALAGHAEPIDRGTLLGVLDRLGPPQAWVADDEVSAWRRIVRRLASGPEEWRLAYLALTLFVVGTVLFLGGPGLWPLEPAMVAVSILLARAGVAVLAENDEAVGARRWLLYPPLLAFYAALLVLLFIGPAIAAAWAVAEVGELRAVLSERLLRSYGLPFAVLSVGAWCVLLGTVTFRWPALVRALFDPFAEGFGRRQALAVGGIGGLLIALSLLWVSA